MNANSMWTLVGFRGVQSGSSGMLTQIEVAQHWHCWFTCQSGTNVSAVTMDRHAARSLNHVVRNGNRLGGGGLVLLTV